MARLCTLFSGSSGNSYYIGGQDAGILVDAGRSAKQITLMLEQCGIPLSAVKAVFVTHEHTDHVQGLRVFASRNHIKVYASAGTLRALDGMGCLNRVEADIVGLSGMECAGMFIKPFHTSHDCAEGYGYRVNSLLHELSQILGLTHVYNIVIVGAGNIGKALARYAAFPQEGYEVKGIFDIREEVIGREINGITVQNVADLPEFLQQNQIDIGVICTPKDNAQKTADVLTQGGVRALWNFAPIDVEAEKACIENVHLSDSLYVLSYRLTNS